MPETPPGRHELPPDALQTTLQADYGQQVRKGQTKTHSRGVGKDMYYYLLSPSY